jgi:hypothetical protein
VAEELRDLRAKITVETDIVLDSIARARGVEKAEIVREVLHEFAAEQILIARLIAKRMKGEGIEGSSAE